MSIGKNEVASPRGVGRVVLVLVAAMLAWTGGCAHTREERARNDAMRTLPTLTAVITGPAALLLTNTPGFQSAYQLLFDDHGKASTKPTGRLFVRGQKIEVTLGEVHGKTGSSGAFSVVWDAVAGRGYVSSEALQGYALLGADASYSNAVTQAETGGPQHLDGRLVEKVMAVAAGTNGERLSWELTSDVEHGHLPMQIRSLQGAPNFTLTLTKTQASVPPEELFSRPVEFTKYANEAALLSELETREQEYRGQGIRRSPNEGDHPGPGGPGRDRD